MALLLGQMVVGLVELLGHMDVGLVAGVLVGHMVVGLVVLLGRMDVRLVVGVLVVVVATPFHSAVVTCRMVFLQPTLKLEHTFAIIIHIKRTLII